jgi:hypothetical protein
VGGSDAAEKAGFVTVRSRTGEYFATE